MFLNYCVMLTMTVWLTVHAVPSRNQAPGCTINGVSYNVGDRITSNPCDPCYCTQYGMMCEMIVCPQTACVDKVRGECCDECPNGPNCLFVGSHGNAIVPEHGCRYSEFEVCYCYKVQSTNTMETFCLPPFPMDATPACNMTSIQP